LNTRPKRIDAARKSKAGVEYSFGLSFG